jgi:steroid 5-alpha reductase family enzyme
MFWFFQSQAVACAVFAVPLLLALLNERPLGWLDALAVVIWLAAVTGETLADRQLARFRHDQRNRGRVCRSGLWAWSRHPNYFFEWLHWWSYVCLAWGAPWGWLAVIGPAVMLYLLLRLTGIPPTEAQAVRSRGEAYREYQRTTSAFIPWPPRRSREQ